MAAALSLPAHQAHAQSSSDAPFPAPSPVPFEPPSQDPVEDDASLGAPGMLRIRSDATHFRIRRWHANGQKEILMAPATWDPNQLQGEWPVAVASYDWVRQWGPGQYQFVWRRNDQNGTKLLGVSVKFIIDAPPPPPPPAPVTQSAAETAPRPPPVAAVSPVEALLAQTPDGARLIMERQVERAMRQELREENEIRRRQDERDYEHRIAMQGEFFKAMTQLHRGPGPEVAEVARQVAMATAPILESITARLEAMEGEEEQEEDDAPQRTRIVQAAPPPEAQAHVVPPEPVPTDHYAGVTSVLSALTGFVGTVKDAIPTIAGVYAQVRGARNSNGQSV